MHGGRHRIGRTAKEHFIAIFNTAGGGDRSEKKTQRSEIYRKCLLNLCFGNFLGHGADPGP